MRIPRDAPPEVVQAFKDIAKELEKLSGTRGRVDLHGTKIGNTGDPSSPRDYVNKAYVDAAIRQVTSTVAAVTKGIRKVRGSSGSSAPAPAPTPLDFGYYRVDTKQQVAGEYGAEVRSYTNLVYTGGVDGYTDTSTPPATAKANLAASISRLANAGFSIMLDVEVGAGRLSVGDALDAARPKWDKVKYLILGEIDLTSPTRTNADITYLKNQVTNRGLTLKPIGFTADGPDIVVQNDLSAFNFDFVNLEAYSPTVPCGTDPAAEALRVVTSLLRQKSAVPVAKFLTVVLQGYDRNGACADQAVIDAINRASYFSGVKGDSRVKAMVIFAYARPGGTRERPTLKAVHQEIWRDMQGPGTTLPTANAKKCIGETRNCDGTPACCSGGTTNPCNCPRLCVADVQYANIVEAATFATIQANPGWFSAPQQLNSEANALLFSAAVATQITAANPTIRAVRDPADGKQVLVRRLTNPEFREDYRVWNTDLTVAFPSGSGYRATCWSVPLDF